MYINASDTVTVPATPLRTLNPAKINYDADFRVVTEKPNETVLTNISNNYDSPETVRFAVSVVKDVFAGTDIPKPDTTTGRPVPTTGKSVLIQLSGCCLDSDAVGDPSVKRYPYSAHLVLKIPDGCLPDEDIANGLTVALDRLLGHLYEQGSASIDTKIKSLIRGATTPREL